MLLHQKSDVPFGRLTTYFSEQSQMESKMVILSA